MGGIIEDRMFNTLIEYLDSDGYNSILNDVNERNKYALFCFNNNDVVEDYIEISKTPLKLCARFKLLWDSIDVETQIKCLECISYKTLINGCGLLIFAITNMEELLRLPFKEFSWKLCIIFLHPFASKLVDKNKIKTALDDMKFTDEDEIKKYSKKSEEYLMFITILSIIYPLHVTPNMIENIFYHQKYPNLYLLIDPIKVIETKSLRSDNFMNPYLFFNLAWVEHFDDLIFNYVTNMITKTDNSIEHIIIAIGIGLIFESRGISESTEIFRHYDDSLHEALSLWVIFSKSVLNKYFVRFRLPEFIRNDADMDEMLRDCCKVIGVPFKEIKYSAAWKTRCKLCFDQIKIEMENLEYPVVCIKCLESTNLR